MSDLNNPDLIDLASSESENEVEYLPVFGPWLAPYQGPYGNWIFPPGCPYIGHLQPQPAPIEVQNIEEDWSEEEIQYEDEDDQSEEEEEEEEEEEIQHELIADDEGYLYDAQFVEENVGHEVLSESDDSGRNSSDSQS